MARAPYKFNVPRQRDDYIKRPAALARAGDAELALVIAPPGYGKTGLLTDIARQYAEKDGQIAWLSCDEQDEAGEVSLASLARAIRTGLGDEAAGAGATVWTDGVNLADALISEMAGIEDPLLLIVDNAHRLTDPETVAALQRLYERGGVRLVLAGRSLPERIGRFVPWTDAVLISAEDLRLSPEEARKLYERRSGGTLSPGSGLYVATEGWPAGVVLSAMADAAGSAGLPVSTDPLTAYMNGLCAVLTEAELDQLARLSIFAVFTADTAALALPGIDAAAFLRDVCARCDIIERDRKSLRFLPMFHDFFAERLRQKGEGTAQALHADAAEAFLARGDWRRAIHHAIRGDRMDLAAEVFLDHARDMLAGGDLQTLLHLSAPLGRNAGRNDTRVRMVEAWACSLTYRFPEALRLLDRLERDDAFGDDPGLATEMRVARATALALADRVSEARVVLADVTEEPDDDWVREVRRNFIAYLDLLDGAFERARTPVRCVYPIKMAYQEAFAAASWAEQGRLRTADRRFSEVFQRARQVNDDEQTIAALIFAFHAPTLFALGRHAEIVERWFRYEAQIRETCPHEATQAAMIARARVDAADGRLDAAQERLEEASTLARNRGWVRMTASCMAERARIWLRQGDPASAARLLERMRSLAGEGDVDAMAAAHVDLQIRLTRTRLDIVTGRARRAVEAAEDLVDVLAGQGRTRMAMRARMLQAAALHAAGETAAAESALRPAQDWARAEGAQVLLALEPPDFAIPGQTAPVEEPVNPLNPREIEVIHKAAGGRTNKEIARELAISPETVKWHLKNIYGKLYVGNRVEAIAEIQRLGMGVAG